MTKFAQLMPADGSGNRVVFQVIEGASLDDLIHSGSQSAWMQVPDATEPGYVLNGTTWTAGTLPAPPPPAPIYPKVSAAVFYTLFSVQEMIDIEANTSADAKVGQFYKRWQIALQGGQEIDLGSQSVSEGLGYLSATTVPSSNPARTYIASSRVAQIQEGVPQ